MATVNQAALPYLLLSLMGGNPGNFNDDSRVEVNVNSDNFDGVVTVPRWALSQAAGASFGYYPTNRWSYDDHSLPSSFRMDSDWYEIRVDLSSFDQDRVSVRVLDSQTIRVEAKQRYVNRYGASTARSVSRRFPVPRTYDVYKLNAKISNNEVLIINIPNKNSNNVGIWRDNGYVRVDY